MKLQLKDTYFVGVILRPLLKYILAAMLISFILSSLLLSVLHLFHPMPLNVMEGPGIIQTIRILNNKPIYSQPSTEYASLIYAPLYYYLSAAVSKLTGVGFFPLRLISFTATLGCFTIIIKLIHRETNQAFPALIGAGIFATGYPITGAIYSIGRTDMLFLSLILLAAYIVRFNTDLKWIVIAGVIMSLAIWTKQSGLIMAVSMGLYIFLRDRTRGTIYSIIIISSVFIIGPIYNSITQGWAYYYLIYLPSEHKIIPIRFILFWTNGLFPAYSIIICLSLSFLVYNTQNKQINTLFYLILLTSLTAVSLISFVKIGGGSNSLLSVIAGLSILSGLSYKNVSEIINNQPKSDKAKNLCKSLILLFLILQLSGLLYSPADRGYIVGEDRVEKGENYKNMINSTDPTYALYTPYLKYQTGKEPKISQAALWNILKSSGNHPATIRVKQDLNLCFDSGYYTDIYSKESWMNSPEAHSLIDDRYTAVNEIPENSSISSGFYGEFPTHIYSEIGAKNKTNFNSSVVC